MVRGLEPTEEYDGAVTVRTFDDDGGREQIRCRSYEDAIDVAKEARTSSDVVEIVGSDGDLVFDSAEMKLEDWEVEWKNEKRRLAVDVERHECPYDNRACFADDLCVRCQIDKVQDKHY